MEEKQIKEKPSLFNLIPTLNTKKFTAATNDSLFIDTTASMDAIPTTEEIVSPTRTLRESEGRRMSDQYDYPSKKSTDGKTLYHKSLLRVFFDLTIRCHRTSSTK